ncbi:alanine--tRNA ligase [Candidatus Woesearchaeota archaeon]|nr:alanine--tRNA ligase [Candidatus Woesearchaeota archaeon]
MLPDKVIKKEFKAKASKDPDKYYATSVLKQEGFARKKCKSCGIYFWNTTGSNICGDPACSGGFKFLEKSPAKKKLDYIGVWKEFSRLFNKWGYTPIERYPVVARWRDDADFVQASIYDFQPYVVSGEVEPPANPLVVPQLCLRFNDIDNVGITGAHYTAFVMIGQHAFVPPKEYDQDKYFKDIHNWLKIGLGLPNNEITFHEDAWAGGGNFGPCMEFFSRGLELGNQVYMFYQQTPKSYKELDIKVLDMGMGHERNSWFTQSGSTSYDTTFPTVCKKLYSQTGIKVDKDIVKRFLPYSSYLNIDEVENIDKVWKQVASKVGVDVKELKENILPLAGLYSIGEHTRALLIALSDGALPSNVGGGYNLRVILRRALSFIDKYGWNISLPEICNLHASYLKPIFPELSSNLDDVTKILEVEKRKYNATKEKSRGVIKNLIKSDIKENKLLQLYDSQGINPETIREEALKLGKKVVVPEDFYARVAELHEKEEQEHSTKKQDELNLKGVPETQGLYFDDYKKIENTAKVLKIINNLVVLDKTVGYPTSGGQIHDMGTINNNKIKDIFKQGNVIVHSLEEKPKFKTGDNVKVKIDLARRKQLAQHHTSTHIVNAAAKRVLGNHINQAGAKKTTEKSTLDITHYESVGDDALKKIEKEANKIVNSKIPVLKKFYARGDAEKKFGVRIYQGGAVPGKNLRIVDIKGVDIEACGGTHLNNTSEAGEIKLTKSTKIQDGIVRLTFTAGGAAEQFKEQKGSIIEETAKILGVKSSQVPARAQELFDKWRIAKKAVKKNKKIDLKTLELVSTKEFKGDTLEKTAEIFRTQVSHLPNISKRFIKELNDYKNKIKVM